MNETTFQGRLILHGSLIPSEKIDDFVILRAVKFTSKIRRAVVRDVLKNEELQVLEWQLLFSVARFGSCQLADITRQTSIDPAHGSRAVSSLEAKGLISRCENPDDKRSKLISLTDDGVAVFERIWPRAQRVSRTVTDQLSADDFKELKRLLDLLNLAVERLGRDESGVKRDDYTRESDITALAS